MADVLTNVGRNIIVGRILGGITGSNPGANAPIYVAWGTGGATAAARTQTALTTEAAEARVTGTASQQPSGSSGGSNDIYRIEGTLTNNVGGVTKTINEGGVFDATKAASGATPVGNMFIRSDFGNNSIPSGDSMILRWDLQFT